MAGFLYNFTVQPYPSYALPAGAGQRYIPPKHSNSALEPPTYKVLHSTFFVFTRHRYWPFCTKASLNLGPQGCHTEVLLALLH